MHAKALEIQMEELAAARHADAMRSSRDIEAAAAQDTRARKALEEELNKERARRQEAEHQLDMLRLQLQQEKVLLRGAASVGMLGCACLPCNLALDHPTSLYVCMHLCTCMHTCVCACIHTCILLCHSDKRACLGRLPYG